MNGLRAWWRTDPGLAIFTITLAVLYVGLLIAVPFITTWEVATP